MTFEARAMLVRRAVISIGGGPEEVRAKAALVSQARRRISAREGGEEAEEGGAGGAGSRGGGGTGEEDGMSVIADMPARWGAAS